MHRRDDHSRQRGQKNDANGEVSQRFVAPGKRTRTKGQPPRSRDAGPAPARGKLVPGAQAAQRKRALDTVRWMDTAMRPDLHPAPVQRAATGKPTGQELPSDGGGTAMPHNVQAKMERAFGTDFSAVRIHEGPRSQTLGARAYTQGTDIHFAPGEYRPSSQSGQELLGHELAHVVQQSQGRVSATTQAKGIEVNDDAGLEAEADEMGARAARGETASSRPSAGNPLQRQAAPIQRQIVLSDLERPLDPEADADLVLSHPIVQGLEPVPTREQVIAALGEANKKDVTVGIPQVAAFVKAALYDGEESPQDLAADDWGSMLDLAEASAIDDGLIWAHSWKIDDEWTQGWLWLMNGEESGAVTMRIFRDLSDAAFGVFLEVMESTPANSKIPYYKTMRAKHAEAAKNIAHERALVARHPGRAPSATGGGTGTGFDATPFTIISQIFEMLMVPDLVRLARTSKGMKGLVELMPLYGIDVTLSELSELMNGLQLRGLHGASNLDLLSLSHGIRPMPLDEGNFDGRSQLGPGFYLTDGSGDASQSAASFYTGARRSALNKRGEVRHPDPAVLGVFTRGLDGLTSKEVPDGEWWDRLPRHLVEDGETPAPDLLTASIDTGGKHDHGSQIKLNPKVFTQLGKGVDLKLLPYWNAPISQWRLFLASLSEQREQ